jgi:hypothetical protein
MTTNKVGREADEVKAAAMNIIFVLFSFICREEINAAEFLAPAK